MFQDLEMRICSFCFRGIWRATQEDNRFFCSETCRNNYRKEQQEKERHVNVLECLKTSHP